MPESTEQNLQNEYAQRYEDVKGDLSYVFWQSFVWHFAPIEGAKFMLKHAPKLLGLAALKNGLVPDAMHKRMPDFYRPEADKLAEIKERLSADEEGRKILALAEEKKIPIRIKDNLLTDTGASITTETGAVSKSTPIIKINSNADVISQTASLFHELRHNEQLSRLEAQNGRSMFMPMMSTNPAAGFVLGRVFEADAFISTTLMEIREAENGRPEYLNNTLKESNRSYPGNPHHTVWKYLKENYPKNYSSPEQFSKGLFDALMKDGLTVYDNQFTSRTVPGVKPFGKSEVPEFYLRNFYNSANDIKGINMDKIIKATEIGGKSYLEGRTFKDITAAAMRGANPIHVMFIAAAEDMMAKKDAMSGQELHQAVRQLQGILVKAMSPTVQRWFARDSIRADIRDKASSFLSKVTTGVMNLFNIPAAQSVTTLEHRIPADMEDRIREPASGIAKPSVAATPPGPLPQSTAPKFKLGC